MPWPTAAAHQERQSQQDSWWQTARVTSCVCGLPKPSPLQWSHVVEMCAGRVPFPPAVWLPLTNHTDPTAQHGSVQAGDGLKLPYHDNDASTRILCTDFCVGSHQQASDLRNQELTPARRETIDFRQFADCLVSCDSSLMTAAKFQRRPDLTWRQGIRFSLTRHVFMHTCCPIARIYAYVT